VQRRDEPEHVHFASRHRGHVVRAVSAVVHDVFKGDEMVEGSLFRIK
jgi:hypothetical protein